MAARPGLPATPARHGSYLPQKGWFPSRRNALAVLDQAPVLPTIHYEATSSSGASAASSSAQWMATASIKHGAHKLLGRDHKPATSALPQVDNEKCQQEKRNIASFYDNAKPLPPDQIADSPRNKDLATSSRNLRIQDFELIKTLGTGTFARVWLACLAGGSRNSNECKVFALKILRKSDIIRLKQVEHIRNERNTLAAVAGHPFITTLITTFSDRDTLYMLLDYCPGGEVFRYLRSAGRFDLNTARFYAAEIVLILEFLHNVQGIAYRDMKPENILIDAEGHLKLVDFGFAKKVETRETYTLCGTPEYLAPEVIRNSGKYRSVSPLFEPDPAPWRAIFDSGLKPGHGTAVDWWAFGILVYEFLVGTPPFWDNNPMKIYEKICVGKIKFPSDMDEDARSLISGLCSVNPTQRLGNLTGGVDRVKSHPFFAPIDWEALYYRKIKGPIIPKLRHPADASNFDEYEHPPEQKSVYTKEMASKYDHEFKDF
ncbi:MAG: hypothetical protein LQ344_006531 [Seirophora lacunosa]|nr:MAG: hypothetical protein LQ344_006531 [Seirophora lacunosa]